MPFQFKVYLVVYYQQSIRRTWLLLQRTLTNIEKSRSKCRRPWYIKSQGIIKGHNDTSPFWENTLIVVLDHSTSEEERVRRHQIIKRSGLSYDAEASSLWGLS